MFKKILGITGLVFLMLVSIVGAEPYAYIACSNNNVSITVISKICEKYVT
jgi:hypothetical protein